MPTRSGSSLKGETFTAFQSQLKMLKLSPQRHLIALAPAQPKVVRIRLGNRFQPCVMTIVGFVGSIGSHGWAPPE